MEKNLILEKLDRISINKFKDMNKNSICKEEHSQTLPTMISFQNMCSSNKKETIPQQKSLRKNTILQLEDNNTPNIPKPVFTPKDSKRNLFTNRLKNYYSHINANGKLTDYLR